ncbi:MAG: response regulator [Desulfobacterales bacterium]|nr:response regulator [Desulfobacterales bacterium]
MNLEDNVGKILVVDDEESILDIVSEYFELKGFNVLTASHGKEAIEVIKQNRIDCCFTDINMPEMDGLELAEYLRVYDNTLPVIIMTGFPSLDNTLRTLKNGVVDFLIKPVNLNQMEICLTRVLRERNLFVENLFLKKDVEAKEKLEKLNNELLYKVDELNILNKIMGDFSSVSNSVDVFKRVVDLSVELAHADEAIFYIINDAVKDPFEVVHSFSGEYHDQLSQKSGRSSERLEALQKLVLEVASDVVPLLVSSNNGTGRLPSSERSYMIVPLKIREKVFGVLTASVKYGKRRFTEKDLYYLSFMTNKAAFAIENLALYENIYENLFSTLYAFVSAIEAKDTYTKQHSKRVTEVAIQLGKKMGCSKEDLDVLNFAGYLHDIGKIGIPDDILLKPESLTDDEFAIIKTHPEIGASIIGKLGLWNREKKIIRCHHEQYGGNGYPKGLKGEEIPLLARILSVADAFDAMDSDRAYRKRLDKHLILKNINNGKGTQFDPDAVDAFLALFDNGEIIFDNSGV